MEVAGTASDGADALTQVNALSPDVLLLDISMQILDGFEVARQVRQHRLPVKILMLSMHKDASSIRRAMRLDVDGYVLKEEAFDTLAAAIAAVAQGKRFFSPLVTEVLKAFPESGPSETLSPRELEIVRLIAEGKTTKEIATDLGISVKTVDTHRQRIMEKLGCHKATGIVRYAMEQGLLGG